MRPFLLPTSETGACHQGLLILAVQIRQSAGESAIHHDSASPSVPLLSLAPGRSLQLPPRPAPLPTRCSLPRVKGPSPGRWYIRPACAVVTITTLTPMSTPIGGFCVSLLSDDSRDEGQSPYAVRRKLSAVIVGQPLQSPCGQRNN